jgi:hypothetical protein
MGHQWDKVYIFIYKIIFLSRKLPHHFISEAPNANMWNNALTPTYKRTGDKYHREDTTIINRKNVVKEERKR